MRVRYCVMKSFCHLYGGGRSKFTMITLGLALFWAFLYYSGLYLHLIEKDYYSEFSYPLEGNIEQYVDQLMVGESPDLSPINVYNYSSIYETNKCAEADGAPKPIRLLFVVKSALDHFEQRDMIRQTWGWEQRFSDVSVRRLFVLGTSKDWRLQKRIKKEHDKHGDVLQFDFVDAYYNNTIKTMLGMRWIVERCSLVQFVMFADDDMYVSAKNTLRFLRNPQQYPRYLQRRILEETTTSDFQTVDRELLEKYLLAGFTFFPRPLRFVGSKWHITYEEYPFSRYPPYVTAGAFIVNLRTVKRLYFASLYVKHFRFDDVYVGILAKKMAITPLHLNDIHYWKEEYDKRGYRYVIASHGYHDPQELLKVWHEQRSLGNA